MIYQVDSNFFNDFFNDIFSILVNIAGAVEKERGDFIHHVKSHKNGYCDSVCEYRFVGKLGFGGKFYFSSIKNIHVSCYEENKNLSRLWIIKRTNNALVDIATKYKWLTEIERTKQ